MPSRDASVGDTVLPGDHFFVTSSGKGKICLGPGLEAVDDLKKDEDRHPVACIKSGILRFRSPNFFWVDTHQRRYVAGLDDGVVGVVLSKLGVDFFRVDIGAAQPAVLSAFHFEGATKKNRPNVKVGDLLFCRILVADKERETEVSCVDAYGKASGMGPLEDGMMIQTSLNCVRKLKSNGCVLLKFLGKRIPFEYACGMNGRIWVKARSVKNTIAICNAMQNSEFMTNDQIKLMIRSFVDSTHAESSSEMNIDTPLS